MTIKKTSKIVIILAMMVFIVLVGIFLHGGIEKTQANAMSNGEIEQPRATVLGESERNGSSIMLASVVESPYFKGSGTATSPFIIATATDFAKFLELVRLKHIISGTTLKYLDANFELSNDIDLTGRTFEPITSFGGVLDGKDYKISNLKVSASKGDKTSLFILMTGTIKNIEFINISVIKFDTPSIVTFLTNENRGLIENITVGGDIVIMRYVDNYSSGIYRGSGFCGDNYGVIRNVNYSGKGEITISSDNDYSVAVSGFVLNNYAEISDINLDLSDIVIKSYGWSNRVAGLIIANESSTSIRNVNVIMGKVSVSGSGTQTIGGLVVSGNIKAERCTVTFQKDITISSSSYTFVYFGGIMANGSSADVSDSMIRFNAKLTLGSYNRAYAGGIGTLETSCNVTNTLVQVNDVSITSYENYPVYFSGFSSNAKVKNSAVTLGKIQYSGSSSSSVSIAGGSSLTNVYGYSNSNSTIPFARTSTKKYHCGILDNNNFDAKIKETVGEMSSSDVLDVPIKSGDKLIDVLEKWVKKNGTFENQYARWGIDLSGVLVFPYLTYENPITELLYNGEILVGSLDINNPTSVLMNQNRTYTWIVYAWSSMEIVKDNKSVTVHNDDGNYSFTCEPDTVTTYTIKTGTDQKHYVYFKIVIDKVFPVTNEKMLQTNKDFIKSKYYEFNNKYYLSYDEAYVQYKSNAINKFVETKQLTDANLFAEKLAPGESVKVGTYYRYNKNGSYVCYFDYDNLIKRIESEFQNEVKVLYTKYGQNLSESKITQNMFDSEVTTHNVSAYLLKDFIFKQDDSVKVEVASLNSEEYKEMPFGAKISTIISSPVGVYKVKETDDAGNVTKYNIYFDNEIQDMELMVQMYGATAVNKRYSTDELRGGVFYFETLSIKNVFDADRQSIVAVTNGGKTTYYNVEQDEFPTLTDKGEYGFEIYDRSGNELKFKALIGTETPKVDFSVRNGNLAIAIEEVKLREFKSINITNNATALTEDKNGVAVVKSNLNYVFDNGGYYTVIVVDGFGRTLKYEYLFEKNMPKFDSITGIKNDVAIDDVTIRYDTSKYIIEILKDGKEYVSASDNGRLLIPYVTANNGEFTVYLKDINDNKFYTTTKFKLLVAETILPTLTGVTNGGQTGGEVRLIWKDNSFTATYSKDAVYLGKYNNGAVLKENGYYAITATDRFGKSHNYTFTIKENLDYRILVGGRYVTSLSKTNESVQFETAFPRENVIVLKDEKGSKIDYRWGEVLSAEGKYSVQIISSSSSSSLNFEIDKTPPRGTLKGVSNGGQTNGNVSLSWVEEGVTAKLFKDGKLKETYEKARDVNEDGKFVIELSDEAKNVTSFSFHIKRSVEITMNVINGGVSNKPVQLSSSEAELEIEITKDGEQYTQKLSKAFDKNGHYTFKAYDAYKNEKEFEFFVVITPVKVFEYTLPQGYSFVEIYKDNYNYDVGQSLNLTKDGKYECFYINTESRQKFSFNVEIDTIPPVVRLIGVENGGSTEGGVTIVSDDKDVRIEVIRNDSEYKTSIGKEIKSDGDYVIRAYDAAGNETTLGFVINYSVNGAGIGAIGVGGSGLGALIVKILKKKKPQ